jgi:CRP/FNR family transcriptional regulator, anaerobic regulatory protein
MRDPYAVTIQEGVDCASCKVRLTSVCASLPEDELELLGSLARSARFGEGETLFLQGQPADQVYNVTSGIVRLYKLLQDGRCQIVGFAMPGDFLGLALGDAYGYSADAIEDVAACAFAREDYSELVDAKPHLLRRLHELSNHELTLAQEQMMLLGRRTAEEKIICFLLGMQKRWARVGKPSVTVPLPMSRQDIADFLGLTIETVSRTLTKLAREKVILIVPDGVRLMQPDRLAVLAAG